MLKEYAVALVLSTATPVAADSQEGAKKVSESQKETVTQPQTTRPITGAGTFRTGKGTLRTGKGTFGTGK